MSNPDLKDHLESLELRIRALTRVLLTLALLACFVFASFAWQPSDRPTQPPNSLLGRYQMTVLERGKCPKVIAIDTWTGTVKPIMGYIANDNGNLYIPFDAIK